MTRKEGIEYIKSRTSLMNDIQDEVLEFMYNKENHFLNRIEISTTSKDDNKDVIMTLEFNMDQSHQNLKQKYPTKENKE